MPRRKRTGDDALERRQASREIGQAYRTVTAIRTLYFCTAGLAGVFLLASLTGGNPKAIAVFAVATGLLLAGGFQVMHRPGEWSVGIAVVVTALNALMLSGGPINLTNIWGIAIAFCLWAVVPLAFRVRNLLAKHGDLYIAEKWKGTRTAPRATERGRRIARETDRQKQRKLMTTLVLIGAFVVFAAGLTMLPKLTGPDDDAPGVEETPRPEFGNRAIRFRSAWNGASWDAVAEFLAPRDRPRRSAKLQRILERRDWGEARPRLELPDVAEDRRGRMIATYPLEGRPDVALEIRWEAGETEWWWTGSKWPPRDD
jgi:hypothetical protein